MRLSFCLLSCLLIPSAFAQRGTGELRLTVTDNTSAGVAATAELVNQAANAKQSVTLPADGRYSFKNLPFGFYRVLVAQPGFLPFSSLLEIRSESPRSLDVVLGIQPIETAVIVKDSDTLFDPNRTSAAYYVGQAQLKERRSSLAGRGLIDMAALQPGWFLEANGSLRPRESEYQTQYIMNGIPLLENRSPAFTPGLEADDVQSMKIYASGIPAEFGRKLGGIVEINTESNVSPGFHGVAVAQGGSFDTAGGFVALQYVAGRTTSAVSANGFVTDRYLDPPVQANFSNRGSSSSATGSIERDFSAAGRLRASASHRAARFLVPNEFLQQAAGQRQDRAAGESEGRISYQRVLSPALVAAIRGMARDVSARLWSNPLATPMSAAQDRGFREAYVNGSLSGHRGVHEWKAGGEADFASLRETFGYRIAAYSIAGVRIFDPDTPPMFNFRGRAQDREQSAFVQDLIRLGRLTLSLGLRFDHYRLLVDETAFSPRLGAAWAIRRLGLSLHASYDRAFGTPAFENILVSAAPQTRALNNAGLYLPLRPSRGNYYEAGFTQALAGRARFEANFFRRDILNYPDDDLLVNTGVGFPIAFQKGQVRGAEVKFEVPRWGRFSGFLSYANMIGFGQFPIAGGLFLDDGAQQSLASTERFPVTQDQRNTARAVLRCQILPHLWTSWTGIYNSGLPVESADQPLAFLAAQYGAALVNGVNFDRGRVRPSSSIDASLGADLWRREKRSLTAQFDVLNIADRLNVINFAGLFSGTAIAPPRSFGIRIRAEF